ncbi:AraC family transcriptional regulator [Streptomyces albidus (ex Kaewkla and Franco 2022)]|uniref:AraC family transcriptional regulator n=1 Tax=Streptomyces albidus (ex Kaewkla and Franco 2022) TaxID=722709 RepID=UPI0015EF2916|nr:AraC family transcriptional regulator [Streptomyces albidus (ex Kaewkla and Franco 2022)]
MSKPVSGIDAVSRRLRIVNSVVRGVVHPPGSRIGPRVQSNVQLMLIHAGTMVVNVDDRDPYTVPAGQMCILLPGHTEVIGFAEGAETRQTLVRGELDELTPQMNRWLEALRPTRPLSSALTYMAREALITEQTRLTAQGALVDALATALLWRFIAEFENLPAALPAPIEDARLFIHRNVQNDIDLTALSTVARVSPEHLVRLFREHMNTTPMRYLWDRRVTHGIELLTSSGLPVGSIAACSGFKTSFHFARKVKEATGLSPTALRARNWSQHSTEANDDQRPSQATARTKAREEQNPPRKDEG